MPILLKGDSWKKNNSKVVTTSEKQYFNGRAESAFMRLNLDYFKTNLPILMIEEIVNQRTFRDTQELG
jgi:hypothetical protein